MFERHAVFARDGPRHASRKRVLRDKSHVQLSERGRDATALAYFVSVCSRVRRRVGVRQSPRPAHTHSGMLPTWSPHSPHHQNMMSMKKHVLTLCAVLKGSHEELKHLYVTLYIVETGCHCAINDNAAELFAIDVRFQ
ncbi:hypothetical protein [Paraburkholderia steynii]|nr:hypothetical protein [Paraburkholderia steynii]